MPEFDASPPSARPDAPPVGGTVAIVGYGFIGRRMAAHASARGQHVRAIGRSAAPAGSDVEYVHGDAADPDAAAALVDGVDHVVYCAGTTKPAESNVDPSADMATNLRPLISVLEAIAATDPAVRPHVTFLSSGGTVYGPDAAGSPVDEDTPLWPISSYGVMKVASERYVSMYARLHGFTADILRCSNVYGPGQPTTGSQGVIGIFTEALRAGRAITLYGDGSACRDFVHVDDIADVTLRLADARSGRRVLNVGSGEILTITELVGVLADQLGVEPIIDRRPARAFDVPTVTLDIRRLRDTLEFDPRPIRDGLRFLDPKAVAT